MRQYRGKILVGLIVLFALGFPAASAHAGPLNIIVDDNGVECPNPDATTLQDAMALVVNNGPANITICAGTYDGPLVIDDMKGINVRAQGVVVVRPDPSPIVPTYTLFINNSNNVLVEGLLLQGAHQVDAVFVTLS